MKQLSDLRDEAGRSGDKKMYRICEKALDGDVQAIVKCVETINGAEAMVEKEG
jgi:hypothetical protein